jgi:hypothetical protein
MDFWKMFRTRTKVLLTLALLLAAVAGPITDALLMKAKEQGYYIAGVPTVVLFYLFLLGALISFTLAIFAGAADVRRHRSRG